MSDDSDIPQGRIAAVEESSIGVWSWDPASTEVTWNRAMHRITGHPTAIAPSEWFQILAHPEDAAVFHQLANPSLLVRPGELPPFVARIRRPRQAAPET